MNALVAPPTESSALAGTLLIESVNDLATALDNEDWLAAGLAGVGTALDTLAAVSDPLGTLIGAGLGWVMEHLEPLKGWLNDLTGDANAVAGFAATWDNIAAQLDTSASDLEHVTQTDLELMSGASLAAYTLYARDMTMHLRAVSGSSASVASSLRTCGMVVQIVHDLVRDTLAELAGAIISWAAEIALTVGLATPWVIEQITTRVASLTTRVGRSVFDVTSSAKALKELVLALKKAIDDLAENLRIGKPKTQVADSPKAAAPADSTIGPAARPQSLDEIQAWLGDVNPGYIKDPDGPHSINCGNCTLAVRSRLGGGPVGEADLGTLRVSEMEAFTGVPQVKMSPDEIADALRAGGAGSHAVIGIDRAPGIPGHWFNAYFDGSRVVAVDGQTGTISGWPPNMGALHWDAAIWTRKDTA
ncbi:toxin glutamine deamidase domain-containing protein [Sanguibacter sp. 25GB23B1]|uniref:toxin glutamine deamidase domain-containing protein n=1 Tax=unclassified Sanguibacter TaxID=2645534 RepID=UPI0032AF29B6